MQHQPQADGSNRRAHSSPAELPCAQVCCNSELSHLMEAQRALRRDRRARSVQRSLGSGPPCRLPALSAAAMLAKPFVNVAMALLTRGDEVLILAAYWTTFLAHAVDAGGTPVFIETRHNKCMPRLMGITAAVTSKAKAIAVHTPNNPTGAMYDRDKLAGIAQLAIDRDLWIIFDECYASAWARGLSIVSTLRLVPPGVAQDGIFFNLDIGELQRRAKGNGCELNADDVASALLMNLGIAALPGTAFGDPTRVRLSYGIDLELFDGGLRLLARTLNTWN